jgi:hypothetical protein
VDATAANRDGARFLRIEWSAKKRLGRVPALSGYDGIHTVGPEIEPIQRMRARDGGTRYIELLPFKYPTGLLISVACREVIPIVR